MLAGIARRCNAPVRANHDELYFANTRSRLGGVAERFHGFDGVGVCPAFFELHDIGHPLVMETRGGDCFHGRHAPQQHIEHHLQGAVDNPRTARRAGDQADMIENIIELRDVDVAEVMTPRPDMVCIDIDDPIEKTIDVALKSRRSRLPVFRQTRDDIVGVLYVRDLIAALAAEKSEGNQPSTQDLMRQSYFVPETMVTSNLLRHFQQRTTTMAIVVDEYGGTAGLVTIGDIVDMIVGEVRDQHEPQREPEVIIVDDHTLEADARMPVRKLNEDFGIDIPESDEYDTVAGYLCCILGRVPQAGDSHTCEEDDAIVLVLEADERHVERVRITTKDRIKRD